MTDRPAGPILDGLGVTLDVEDDQMVTSAVVIAKVASLGDGGGTAVVLGGSDGMDWIEQLGIHAAGQKVLDDALRGIAEDDD